MKKIVLIIMLACSINTVFCCMTVRHNNAQLNTAKKRLLSLQHSHKQAERFANSFNTYSLSNVREKFLEISPIARKKAVSLLNDNQLYVLGVSIQFPGEVKNHIVGLLFNGHNNTAQMYGELPFLSMVKTSIKIEAFKRNYPLTITGKNADVSLSYEHYVHLTQEDLDCLTRALVKQETIADRERCASALRVIKSIEEDKIKQSKISQQTQFTQALISRPFSYTVSLEEDENGVKRVVCNSGNTIPELCADWMLSSPDAANQLSQKIFRANKWNDVKSHLKKEKQNDFQFKGNVTVKTPLLTWLLNSFGWSSFAPGITPRWGGKPLSMAVFFRAMRMVVDNAGLGNLFMVAADPMLQYGEGIGYLAFVLEGVGSLIHHNYSSQSIDLNELVK
jgi:hypothetical protein